MSTKARIWIESGNTGPSAVLRPGRRATACADVRCRPCRHGLALFSWAMKRGARLTGMLLKHRRLSTLWPWAHRPAVRAATVAGLVLVSFLALRANEDPGLAVSMYGVVPVLLAVTWFGVTGGLLSACGVLLAFLVDALLSGSPALAGGDLAWATLNRGAVFFGAVVLVTRLMRREQDLTRRLERQEAELAELASLRLALTPPDVPRRPQLEFATAFTPADGALAGDFFLVAEGPSDSTTVVVGDVVGHGLEAARIAAFVRATLATFARYSADPAQLLQLANAALVERDDVGSHFVTAVCVNLSPPPDRILSWAAAGHDRPWCLDSGTALQGGRVGAPLGVDTGLLGMEAGQGVIEPGSGVLLFTDGLTEGRGTRAARTETLELFGEDRARAIVQAQHGAPVEQVLAALMSAVASFAGGPLADDLCLVAFRTQAVQSTLEPSG